MKNYVLATSTNGRNLVNTNKLPLEDDNYPNERDVAFREIQAIKANKWLNSFEKEDQIRKIREQFKDHNV